MIAGAPSGSRRRRRGRGWALLIAAAALVLLFLAATSAYRLAASRFGTETGRLREDLAAVLEQNRLLNERVALAEQRGAMAVARAAQVERDRRAGLPQGDAERLLRLVERKLGQGVPASRLTFVLENARPQPACGDKLDVKRLQPRTPSSTSAAVTVTFSDSKVVASANAAAAPANSPQGEAGFDARQPVELRFTTAGGRVETARGPLPLGHAFVLGQNELRFLARASERPPGAIEISLQTCAYP